MARVNVSVPDEMKERMDALADRVNWSEAARSAFEREIAAATMPDDPDFGQVVERLQKSKADSWQANLKQARERGREWAKKNASYNQLKTVVRVKLTEQGDFAGQFDRLTFEEDSGDYGGYFTSTYAYYGHPMPPDDYVEAFVEGVKDVWIQVADKI
jgi:predicted DNA-binding protein